MRSTFARMSATEVIEEIKRLQPEERAKVFAFLADHQSKFVEGEPVHYMDTAKAKSISAQIFSEHAELFRKLAR